MIAETAVLLRAPSGNGELIEVMMGPTVWGPRATHGGRGAGGEAPLK